MMDDKKQDETAKTHSTTDLNPSAQALPFCEAHYHATLDAVDDSIHIVDSNLQFIHVNECFTRWVAQFGITGSVIGKGLREVFPFLPDPIYANYRTAFETNAVHRHETSVPLGETVVHLDIRLVPVREHGQVTHIITIIRDLTQHKQAIAALEESEQRYRGLVERSPLGIFIHSGGTVVFANSTAAQIVGYDSAEEMNGLDIFRLVHPDFHAVIRARIEAIYDRRHPVPPIEEVYVRKDGTTVEIEVAAAPIEYQGKPASQVIFHDISAKKRIQRQLDAQRRLLHSIIDTSPDLIAFRDRELVYRLVNQAFCDFHALSSEEVIGKTNEDLYPEEQAARSRQENRLLITSGETSRHRRAYRGARGDVVFDLIKIPLRDESGEISGLLSFGRDVTEQQAAEAAVRDSEHRYRLLAETAGDIILTHDLEGRITYANPAGLALSGYSAEEVLHLTLADVVPAKYMPQIREQLARRKDGDMGRHRYEVEFSTKTGQLVPIEAVSTPIVQDGIPLAMLVIARDLTERKRLEEQLRQAQKMETVGRLAGGVAHDFNNLLTTITGYSHFVKMALDADDPASADIDEVLKAAERATRLTKQLLAFSRRQMISPRLLNLNELLIDMGKMLRRLIGEHIEMVILPSANDTQIKADPSQIEQVIINLAVNARDAMPGGGTLIIRTANANLTPNAIRPALDLQPGQYVVLTVSDTGVGMDEEIQAHLFEPFFTTKEVGKGTGLGLATVYGIVKQHGGDIMTHSEPGQGSMFRVYLPRASEPLEESDRTADYWGNLPMGHETILVVEDEPSVRSTTVRILKDLGYEVLEACNGEEALRVAQIHGEELDMLLTDVVMPQMNGSELAARFSAAYPQCGILFVSGYTDDTIVRHGVSTQDVRFLEKPYTLWELARKVRQVLDARGVVPTEKEQTR